MSAVTARPFCREDIPQVLELMKSLARFEDYIEDFTVTAEDLERYGLCDEPRFRVHVATGTRDTRVIGIAVTYTIPWTYDMKPVLVLKELFVEPSHRSRGVGEALMIVVMGEARAMGASKIQWTVLADNHAAKRFYARHGAGRDTKWDLWSLPIS